MQESTTVRAETVEKAINIALTKLNLSRDEADVNIINEGKKGLFGFGKQDAIVEVTAKKAKSIGQIMDLLEQEEQLSNKPNSPMQKATEDTPPAQDEPVKVEKPTAKREPKVETVLEVVEVQVTETVVEAVSKPKAAPVKVEKVATKVTETPIPAATVDVDEEDDEDYFDAEPTDESLESPESKAQRRKEANEKVANYLQNVIREYGADADVTVEDTGYQVIFNIETSKSGLVIGKHGKIINALQTLAQILLHRYNRRRVSVILNVGDYRDRRANVLEQIAERTAKDVLRSKQAVILDPLPAYERKQIHAYLSKVEHIKTHSEGKDPNRYLVVEYDNKTDY